METIRTYLQDELIRRCKTNPRYSLRSFAKHLQMNPSLLSKILRGQIGVSAKRFAQVCERMELGPNECLQLATAEERRRAFERQEQVFRELMKTSTQICDIADRLGVIVDWYHYAILELMTTETFCSDESWIARRLHITTGEVAQARNRLVRLGLLEIDNAGNWIAVSSANKKSRVEINDLTLRSLQTQVLNLALGALEVLPAGNQFQGTTILSLDSELVASAQEKIIAFQRALTSSLQEQSHTRDAVYLFSTSFFPLTDL